MRDWLANLAGPEYVDAILWTLAALALLVVVLAALKLVGTLNGGTYVAGGRNRKTRLAVMDATAVDGQRRLVLVRRDDVEHLLLIGGPTDVVVEQDIRMTAPRRAPAPEMRFQPDDIEEALPGPSPALPHRVAPPAQRPAPELSPPHGGRTSPPPVVDRTVRPAPQPEIRRAPAERSPPPEPRMAPARTPPAVMPRATPVAPPVPRADTRSAAPRPPAAPPPAREDQSIEETLMKELDFSDDDLVPPEPPRKAQPPSLDDEMARLLGELSNPRR